METYLVGGAVRDQLMGKPTRDRDWVVVGATIEDMLAQGFQTVGKDFPVFIHPESGEEYALARKERKSGQGYQGFDCFAEPSVTLEEDLMRRDLTINAIAMDSEGTLIDPYGGKHDIENKILRHVSDAFVEDPLRVLRLARLRAQFPDFHIAPETQDLLNVMVKSGELKTLSRDRVWQETHRALEQTQPTLFIETLVNCGGFEAVFEGATSLCDKQNCIDLQNAANQQCSEEIRFACWLFEMDRDVMVTFCDNNPIPNTFRDIALLTQTIYPMLLVSPLNAEIIYDIFKHSDAFRRSDRLFNCLKACEVLAQTRKIASFDNIRNRIETGFENASKVDISELINSGLTGQTLGAAIQKLRIEAI